MSKVTLSAAPSFLNCFYRLVVSIMHEGRQRGDTEKGADPENLQTFDFGLSMNGSTKQPEMEKHSSFAGRNTCVDFVPLQLMREAEDVKIIPVVCGLLGSPGRICFDRRPRVMNTAGSNPISGCSPPEQAKEQSEDRSLQLTFRSRPLVAECSMIHAGVPLYSNRVARVMLR
ncbi:hypothetical protein Z043_117531, partial [Scleropages formosus]